MSLFACPICAAPGENPAKPPEYDGFARLGVLSSLTVTAVFCIHACRRTDA